MAKKKILTDNGQEILPITHESCVLDNDGVSIGSKIGNINELATDSRTDLVSAINDILYFNNNSKQQLIDILTSKGIIISENETIDNIISKINIELVNNNISDRFQILMEAAGFNTSSVNDLNDIYTILNNACIRMWDVKQVVGSLSHTMILKNDGSLWGCGYNYQGQLGVGGGGSYTPYMLTQATTNINNDVKYVACGSYHTIILKNDGSVWSCGNNASGQLGLGDTTNRTTFTQVTTNINNDVKEIVCGDNYTFMIKNDGSLWACGAGYYCGANTNGGGLSNTKVFSEITAITNVKSVSVGVNFTYVLKNDGSLWSCGCNHYGQLGIGTSDSNEHREFTQVNSNVKQVICGYQQAFIIKNDGSVWATGNGSGGRLGLGNTGHCSSFTQVTTNINNDVKQISTGGTSNNTGHTILLKNDGTIWTCGDNGNGQTGLSSSPTIFTQVTTNISDKVNYIFAIGNRSFITQGHDVMYSCGDDQYYTLGLDKTDGLNVTAFKAKDGGFKP